MCGLCRGSVCAAIHAQLCLWSNLGLPSKRVGRSQGLPDNALCDALLTPTRAITMNRRDCSALLVGTLCKEAMGMPDTVNTELIEHPSDWPFAETVERVSLAIRAAGMRIFAVVDHAAGAAEVGLGMPPSTLLIYGHPKGGTPIMQVSPQAALDLPLRVLIRADATGLACVCFHPVVPLLARYGVPEMLALRLMPAQAVLLAAVRK